MKDAAFARLAARFQPDPATVPLDDSLADREPQAETSERRSVRAPEPLEHQILVFLGNAEAMIPDLDVHSCGGLPRVR